VPDLLMAAIKHQAPVFTPITIVTFGLFFLSAVRGLRRSRVLMPVGERRDVSGVWLVRQAIVGAVYMAHWLPVIAFTTARMAVRKKRLKWVKTVHSGQH
jgi:1,2-diacylglycerol 3-beta-glucosyltransferase